MTDVRLTAINPEDSSVVPVACNAGGELKLEEPIEFDGNFDGDLSVTGTGKFSQRVVAGSNAVTGLALSAENNNGQAATIYGRNHGAAGAPVLLITDSTSDERARINNDGTASFKGSTSFSSRLDVTTLDSKADLVVQFKNTDARGIRQSSFQYTNDGYLKLYSNSSNLASTVTLESSDGSATFAAGKAGITAEGYLWCTTRRGDTVILDATSGGLATWADYTPPTRREQAEERINALREERGDGSDTSDKSRRNNR